MMATKSILFSAGVGLLAISAMADETVHDHDEHEHDHEHSDEEAGHASGEAHVHGAWALFAAMDDATLSVTLTGPLQDVFGFEAPPSSVEQIELVEERLDTISNFEGLVQPDSGGACTSIDALDIKLPEEFAEALEHADHDEHESDHHADEDHHEDHHDDAHDHDGGQHDESAHADIDITLLFECADAEQLKSIQVNVFTLFPSVETVDAVFLGDTDQVASRLTADESTLATR